MAINDSNADLNSIMFKTMPKQIVTLSNKVDDNKLELVNKIEDEFKDFSAFNVFITYF